ncbi:hypothetical protein SDJN03_27362, partial [Cucurbita argyrosperma subsp. sororia]
MDDSSGNDQDDADDPRKNEKMGRRNEKMGRRRWKEEKESSGNIGKRWSGVFARMKRTNKRDSVDEVGKSL